MGLPVDTLSWLTTRKWSNWPPTAAVSRSSWEWNRSTKIALEETNKPFNRVKKFADEIKMFHDHGIMVNPGIVFGFDNDDESVFERAVEFLTKTHVELAYFNVLTPLPGTALFDRYNSTGRIFDRDWAKYDGKHVVFIQAG